MPCLLSQNLGLELSVEVRGISLEVSSDSSMHATVRILDGGG